MICFDSASISLLASLYSNRFFHECYNVQTIQNIDALFLRFLFSAPNFRHILLSFANDFFIYQCIIAKNAL